MLVLKVVQPGKDAGLGFTEQERIEAVRQPPRRLSGTFSADFGFAKAAKAAKTLAKEDPERKTLAKEDP